MSDLTSFLESFKDSGSGSGAGFQKVNFLKLPNDKDSAIVKILIRNKEEATKYAKPVHKVKLGKYDNYILCTGEDCACCKAGLKVIPRIAIPIYNFGSNQVEIWMRGKPQIEQIIASMEDYGEDLSANTFKIVRHGAAGSTDTNYQLMYQPKDRQLPDGIFEQIPKVVGRDYKLFIDLTPEQQTEAMLEGKVTWTHDTPATNTEDDTNDIPF